MEAERQSAVMAILEAHHIPAGMELFTANDKSQWETIKRWIDESDVFLLILGGRYGTVDCDSGKSYIEMEFDYAISRNKPLFSIIISEQAMNDKIAQKGECVVERDNGKFEAFKKKVNSKLWLEFNTPHQLKYNIFRSLKDYESDQRIIGWIRPSDGKNLAITEVIHEHNSVQDAETTNNVQDDKKKKDVENVIWIFKRINLEIFDVFRDNLPERLYMPVVDFFAEDIKYCYNSSLFHIHNQELKILIDDFCHSLGAVCSLGGRLHHPSNVNQAISANPDSDYNKGTGFYSMHGLETMPRNEEVCQKFEEACSKFLPAYQQLIPFIRNFYSLAEVNIDKLSVEAHNAFVDFLNERKAMASQTNPTKQKKRR